MNFKAARVTNTIITNHIMYWRQILNISFEFFLNQKKFDLQMTSMGIGILIGMLCAILYQQESGGKNKYDKNQCKFLIFFLNL